MAREYEEEYTKDEILEQYLNTASYGTNDGRTAVGVEAASQVFFDKAVEDLSLKEAALLAGLPQAPTDYNPFPNPKGATERRNQVLDAMADAGLHHRSAKAEQLKDEGLGLERGYHYETRERAVLLRLRPAGADRHVRRSRRSARAGSRSIRRSIPTSRRPPSRRSPPTRPPAPPTRSSRPTPRPARSSRWPPRATYDDEPVQPRRPGRAPARLVVQAVRADDRGRPGHRPGLDLLPGAVARSRSIPHGTDGAPWTVSGGGGGSISLRDATANSVNTVYAQLGHRRRARELRRDGAQDGHHLARSTATRPRRSAAQPTAARCSRCRTPTRRSPTAASTTTRPAIEQGRVPRRRGRRARGRGGQPRDHRRRRLHGRRRDEGHARVRHRRRPGHRLPGLRQDRHDRGAGRRLVRRLHAARLDRGLGRQPGRAHRRCPATAPTSPRRSGTTT